MDWLGQDGRDIAALWDDGKSASEIGKVYGVSRNTICSGIFRLKAKGMITRQKGLGWITKGASKPCTRATITIDGVTFFYAPQWPEDKTRQLMDAWDSDMDLRDIATSMDRTVKSIDAKVRQLISVGLLKARAIKPKRVVEKPHTVAGLRVLEERKAAFQDFGQSALSRMESAELGTGKPIEELKFKQCRFPTGGSQPQWLFCGNEIERDVKSSYCAACRPRAVAGYTWRNEPKAQRVAA